MNAGLVIVSLLGLGPLDANGLYQAGRIDEARLAYARQLAAERASAQPDRLWIALMASAWFEEAVGEHVAAIEHSNEALEVAEALHDDFRRGRSLDWLGWSWASLGYYAMAERFYLAAVALGAPDGVVRLVPVWGLAQQELGAVYFRQGKLKEAKAAVESTYDYATHNGIDIGVAEGGAHLAEMALYEKQDLKAERLARLALEASRRCDCSVTNTLRAQLVLARAVSSQAQLQTSRRDEARRLVTQAMEDAKAHQSPRFLAEAELLLAGLPETPLARRLELTSAALERLSTTSDELRGRAEISLGEAYLSDHRDKLARFYTARGVKVTLELMREVDRAWAMGQLARLDALPGSKADPLSRLSDQVEAAVKTGDVASALEAQRGLAERLERAGYFRLAAAQARDALGSVRALARGEATPKQLEAWRGVELGLLEQLTRLSLKHEPLPGAP